MKVLTSSRDVTICQQCYTTLKSEPMLLVPMFPIPSIYLYTKEVSNYTHIRACDRNELHAWNKWEANGLHSWNPFHATWSFIMPRIIVHLAQVMTVNMTDTKLYFFLRILNTAYIVPYMLMVIYIYFSYAAFGVFWVFQ